MGENQDVTMTTGNIFAGCVSTVLVMMLATAIVVAGFRVLEGMFP